MKSYLHISGTAVLHSHTANVPHYYTCTNAINCLGVDNNDDTVSFVIRQKMQLTEKKC